MLGGMAGRRHTEEGCIAERDLGPVLHRSMPERVSGPWPAPRSRHRSPLELQRARDVVVVDVVSTTWRMVGPAGSGGVDEPFDVALRIDDRSLVTPGEDVARVPEPSVTRTSSSIAGILRRVEHGRTPIRVRCLKEPTSAGQGDRRVRRIMPVRHLAQSDVALIDGFADHLAPNAISRPRPVDAYRRDLSQLAAFLRCSGGTCPGRRSTTCGGSSLSSPASGTRARRSRGASARSTPSTGGRSRGRLSPRMPRRSWAGRRS